MKIANDKKGRYNVFNNETFERSFGYNTTR